MVNALRERPQAGARGARRRGMPARPPRACAAPPDAAAAAPAGHAAGPARDVLYPFPEFAAKAHVSSREMYDDMYALSVADPSRFWGDQARQFHWRGCGRGGAGAARPPR